MERYTGRSLHTFWSATHLVLSSSTWHILSSIALTHKLIRIYTDTAHKTDVLWIPRRAVLPTILPIRVHSPSLYFIEQGNESDGRDGRDIWCWCDNAIPDVVWWGVLWCGVRFGVRIQSVSSWPYDLRVAAFLFVLLFWVTRKQEPIKEFVERVYAETTKWSGLWCGCTVDSQNKWLTKEVIYLR